MQIIRATSKRIVSIFLFAIICFLYNGELYPQQFKFAWITDTHVGNTTGENDLINTVRDINTLNDIDFVILSGDITETGKTTDLVVAKKILENLSMPYYVIPGNHDTKWSESGCTKFSQVFGSEKFVFDYEGIRFIGMHEGPIMRMGDGHFSPEDLRWLDTTLFKITNKNQPIIFITHYPVNNQIDNWYEALDRLKKFNTKVILCGHGHSNHFFNFEGIPGVMGRSNLSAKENAGGYNIVEITEESISFTERILGKITKPFWNKVALKDIDYEADTTKYARPDFSINSRYPDIKVKWNFKTHYTITSAPVVDSENVFVTNGSGYAYCLSSSDEELLWKFKTDGAIFGSPDVSKNKVVFGSNDQNIYCVNASTGKLEWKYQTEAPVVAVPEIFDDVVYIGGGDGKFRAFELATGKLIWEFSEIGEFIETKPVVYNDKVIFGAWDSYLYALNIKDGTLAWKWQGTEGFLYSPAACWPVASNGKIFIVAPDRVATAIDAETGKTIWRTNKHQVRESIGISEDGEFVYAKGMNDSLFVFSASSNEAKLIKAIDCKFGYDIAPSMPQEKEGVVYFGTKNGLVIAIDKHKLEVMWKYKTGITLVNTVAAVDNNKIIITNADGEVMLLESNKN
ncbi:MAG: PQQ-binding-like beta-propeller repeat protein [Melioribacteraceae bacterium]|nr:PQQ-binding-like beta-propeller repeat protein [Melioribacteraceae bacterium]